MAWAKFRLQEMPECFSRDSKIRKMCENLHEITTLSIGINIVFLVRSPTRGRWGRLPEAAVVKRDEDLRKAVADDSVAEVVCPVVLVGVARQRMSSPVVQRVDMLPQPWHHVVCCEGTAGATVAVKFCVRAG